MLFSFFNAVDYKGKLTTQIFKNYRAYFNRVVVNYTLKTYHINGSPRPEALAEQIYGNQELYWVILMVNNIYDPFYDWITSQETAYQYAMQQYPKNQVVYHIDHNGEKYWNLVEDEEFPLHWYDKGDKEKKYVQYIGPLRAVDSLEAQTFVNESRREIKIIDPSDINAFLSDFIREMEKADV